MIKKIVPKKIYLWWKERSFLRLRSMKPEQIFSEVYKNNMWGGDKGTFYSGNGSTNPNTKVYLKNLIAFIQDNNIKKILDIGCGDFTLMKQVVEQVDVDYTGGDIVEDMVKHLQSNFQNDNTHFIHLNAINDDLPNAELVTIRQVLQHLNNEQIQKIISKLSTFKYVIITEHLPVTENVEYNLDKITGPHIRMRVNSGVFIDKPPFNVKNVTVLFEYREDDKIKSKMIPAVIRSYLIRN